MVCESLTDYDSTTVLAYRAQLYNGSGHDTVILEYYPDKLCHREIEHPTSMPTSPTDSESVSICNNDPFDLPADLFSTAEMSQEIKINGTEFAQLRFREGLKQCKSRYEKMCSGNTPLPFGNRVYYRELNNTAYCIFTNGDDALPAYPPRLLDTESIEPDRAITQYIDNDIEALRGIYSRTETDPSKVEQKLRAFRSEGFWSLLEEIEQTRDELSIFSSNNEDNRIGDRTRQLTIDEMDSELGINDREWRVIRLLLSPFDDLWEWLIPGNAGGVSICRHGRTFRHWQTMIV